MYDCVRVNPSYTPPSARIESQSGVAVAGGHELADRSVRLAALIIDILLLLAAIIIPGIAVEALTSSQSETLSDPAAIAGVAGMLALSIYQWYGIATAGQTLGKRWTSIMVVKVDGSPVGFVRGVMLRAWLFDALEGFPVVGPLFLVIDSLFIFGEERRCVHDWLAGTIVVKANSR
jgi:uncharacterized RDD family membrane protein YckC